MRARFTDLLNSAAEYKHCEIRNVPSERSLLFASFTDACLTNSTSSLETRLQAPRVIAACCRLVHPLEISPSERQKQANSKQRTGQLSANERAGTTPLAKFSVCCRSEGMPATLPCRLTDVSVA